MDTTVSENQKTLSAFIHVSTFLKYFFPFANFFAPLLLWSTNKEKPFVDVHGKQAINFQLSVLLYTLIIGLLCLPFFLLFASDFIALIESIDHHWEESTFNEIENLTGYIILFCTVVTLLFGLFVLELYAVISATMHAAKGEIYKYPLSIPFIKTNPEVPSELNQSKNEHTN
ncbi:DUF4870 domain-containing protein [Cochleicola gelatinilyticus]|uniref:DUF4870 domain-containing protein n=1 Tax=Cochleicola gelatinilyticus TaxID=1763537 RepID=A0A167GA61_9FLAO|nr:DUF4870 domain-containing protein [Cochleicola gelatinilyticus]OAB77376.1 hypothetical protein ULVI_12815 [Cochleicola gelatinilyticus]